MTQPGTLRVRPQDVAAFARMVKAAGAENSGNSRRVDAGSATTLSEGAPDGGNLLALIQGPHATFTGALGDCLTHLDTVLNTTHPVLSQLAADFARDDEQSRQDLAGATPEYTHTWLREHSQVAGGSFTYTPATATYQQIDNVLSGDSDPYSHFQDFDLNFLGYEMAAEKNFLARFDVHVDKLVQNFSGNWMQLLTSAKAFRCAAAGLTSVSDNLATGNDDLSDTWDGWAADNAHRHFTALTKAVPTPADNLTRAADAYELCYSVASRAAKNVAGNLTIALTATQWALLALPSLYGIVKELTVLVATRSLTTTTANLGTDLMIAAKLVASAIDHWNFALVAYHSAAQLAVAATDALKTATTTVTDTDTTIRGFELADWIPPAANPAG